MSYTKGEIVIAALSQLGIADYEFDISDEEISSGVLRLDAMMSMWSSKSIRVPYNYVGGSDDNSGLPNTTIEAVISNLAIRLGASYGKQIPPDVRSIAKSGLNAILSESTRPRERQLGIFPLGAGYKSVDTGVFWYPREENEWMEADFANYSGDSTALHLGDVGAVLNFNDSGEDLTGLASATIRYLKPSGDTGEWVATVVEDEVSYTTQEGDIDEDGVWYMQVFYDFDSIQRATKVTSVTVLKSITVT